MSRKRVSVDLDDLAQRHASGQSVKSMADHFGVSRPVIVRRLADLGLVVRGRSEAMYIRMANATPEEREALTEASHAALRKHTAPEFRTVSRVSAALRTAEHRERALSVMQPDELLIGQTLAHAGIDCIPQHAVGKYNLDFSVGSIAVEVHSAAYNPATHPRLHGRSVELMERGWSVLYVWLTRAYPWDTNGATELVSSLDALRSLPAGLCEQRVIRGNGKLHSVFHLDTEHRTLVPAPVDPHQV